MPRVHFVKKARKPIKDAGIKRGDSYFWWKFRTGGRGGIKRASKTRPRPSQLTQSEFLSAVLAAEEGLDDALKGFGQNDDVSDAAQAFRDAAESVNEAGEAAGEKADNMDGAFPGGCPTIDLLREYQEAAERIAGELEQQADDLDGAADDYPVPEEGERPEDAYEELRAKIEEAAGAIDWST